MEELLKTKLIELAQKEASSDIEDFNAFDYSGGNYDDAYFGGGNYDDAYFGGVEDGEILLAREILNTFCIKY